jgi:hypothetical protein
MVLHNHEDVQYTGDIRVGGQKMRGVIDTGSFELLVFSKECQLCGSSFRLYNHNESSDYVSGNLDVMHSFGSGDTWSHEAQDKVAIGPFSATNQSFWEVFDTQMPVLQRASFQAIVGLGPRGSAQKLASQRMRDVQKDATSAKEREEEVAPDLSQELLESRKALRHAKRKVDLVSGLGVGAFSVCIGAESGDPGYMIWNDTDPNTQPHLFTHIPTVGSIHWSVELTNVKIGSAQAGDGSVIEIGCGKKGAACGAVLDTGTSLIAAPKEAIEQVELAFKKLNGDCGRLDELPDLVFNLGGSEFSLPPESYIGQVVGDIPPALQEILHFKSLSFDSTSSCQPLIMTVDAYTQFGPMWILGLPFFRRYYTTFVQNGHPETKGGSSSEVFIARADKDCRPSLQQKTHAAFLATSQTIVRRPGLMKLDASQLRVPRWLRDAARKRRHHL